MNPYLGFPDEETMSCDQGLVENHHYQDLRCLDLTDFQVLWNQEEELLSYEGALGDDAYEEVYSLCLDPGVASTVAALAALGACPVSSCSGGPDHYEKHPLVFFWCDEEQLKICQEAATEAGVNLEGVSTPGFLVWHEHSIEPMRAFAKAVVKRLC